MSILYMLNQACDLYAPTMAANGLAEYSGTASSSSVKCRVEENHEQVQRSDGTVVITDATIYVPSGTTVDIDYKVVVSTTSYVVEKAVPVRGLTAVSHYELLVREL